MFTQLIISLLVGSSASAQESFIGNLAHKACPLVYKDKLGKELQTQVIVEGLSIENCEGCAPAYINSYFTQGVEELRRYGLRDSQRAAIYDFDNNCVFLIQTLGSKVSILNSYGASGGRGGVSNRIGSGATSGGVHRTNLGKQEEKRIASSALNANLDPGKTGYVPGTVTPTLGMQDWTTDFVLTRFIRLEGLDPAKNSNSMKRKILFHGTHEEGLLDYHESAGCIRMANHDVIEFYNELPLGSLVNIVNSSRTEVRHRAPRKNLIQYDESKHPGLVKARKK